MSLSKYGLNPYVDIQTGTLYNKVGARSADELKVRENTLVSLRLAELKETPVQGHLDFSHMKEIHRRLFQDVYEWAGQVRQNFNAAKQDFQGGPAYSFIPSLQIETEARRVFDKLAKNDHLQNLFRADFVPQLARLHGELNHLHAFPEGNGRTQRLFLEQVAQKAGHPVDLSIGTEHRIIEASITQTKGQHDMIERFIAEAADPNRVRALRTALNHLNEVWGVENTSRTYIAATVAGQHYSGTLYGKTATDFILRTDDRKLVVGHAIDLAPNATGGARIEITATDGLSQQISQGGLSIGLKLGKE